MGRGAACCRNKGTCCPNKSGGFYETLPKGLIQIRLKGQFDLGLNFIDPKVHLYLPRAPRPLWGPERGFPWRRTEYVTFDPPDDNLEVSEPFQRAGDLSLIEFAIQFGDQFLL
jgi:hypothetical protein